MVQFDSCPRLTAGLRSPYLQILNIAVGKSNNDWQANSEVEFVHPVSLGGSVKFVASGVNFSIFTNFLCFFLLKLLKLGEIGGVKFLT